MREYHWSLTIKKTRFINLLIVVALALVYMPGATLAQPHIANAKIQPQLRQLALEQPDQRVGVIVQKTAKNAGLETAVAQLGGVVTKDLHIINALGVKLPIQAVAQLAANPHVRWVALDGPVESAAGGPNGGSTTPTNYFLDTLNVRSVWSMGRRGEGIGVAVIDSGISNDQDFGSGNPGGADRLVKQVKINLGAASGSDATGHGTHVAGIIGGNGYNSNGAYSGVAPGVNLISLRISDDMGRAYESDTVAALQWVLDNKATYNIRVVNLSINSTVEQSYHTSPLDAAVEILWFNGVVVVASAGNKGPAGSYNTANAAPANDPFIITVGATDERGTTKLRDDGPAPYSASGITMNGFAKPNIMAPGTSIISVLSMQSTWDNQYPDRTVLNGEYFRLSGTSMAAPMVAGAVALLLQDEPNLTPDQVKYRLLNTGSMMIDPGSGVATPYLNVYNAVTGTTTQSANTGVQASQLLWTGTEPITWNSVNWNSVNWNSVNWNSVNWNSVNWNSVNWNSVSWTE